MTGNQLITKFKIKYDITSALGNPGFIDSEILEFLNTGQLRYINKVYTNHNPYREGFGDTFKSSNDLSRLIITDTITLATDYANVVSSTGTSMPDDYMHYVELEMVLGSARHSCQLVKYSQIHPFIATDINTPWIETPVLVLNSNLDGLDYKTGVSVAYDNVIYTASPTIGYLTYIRKPEDIEATADDRTDFLDYSYNNIIDEAVNQAIKITEPELYQIDETETKDNQ